MKAYDQKQINKQVDNGVPDIALSALHWLMYLVLVTTKWSR